VLSAAALARDLSNLQWPASVQDYNSYRCSDSL
jgi:hypothetical protein